MPAYEQPNKRNVRMIEALFVLTIGLFFFGWLWSEQ